MSALPILSVIVPVYNVARFLPILLTKLSHQTLKNLEVILVCDGNDEDFEICHQFVKSDKRFSLISNVKKQVVNLYFSVMLMIRLMMIFVKK